MHLPCQFFKKEVISILVQGCGNFGVVHNAGRKAVVVQGGGMLGFAVASRLEQGGC